MKKKGLLLASVLATAIMLASCGQTTSVTVTSSEGGVSESLESSESSEYVAPTLATGAQSYVDADYAQKEEILGMLEGYAMKNYLAGMPLYDDGGLTMYNPRITKGTDTYIKNYGFSILRDGSITADLSGETVDAYKRYLHSAESNDPQTIAALNSQDNQVSDLNSYISSGYYGTRLNSKKDGYEWYGVLTYKKPAAVITGSDGTVTVKDYDELTSSETHSTWRYYVRTGEQGGVAFRSASSKSDRKAFDGRYATLDDYIYGWKALLNGANNYYRGSEFASQTGSSAIVGVSDYFKVTQQAAGTNPTDAAKLAAEETDAAKAAWDKVGIKGGKDSTGDYIDITWGAPMTRFYAMYHTTDSSYAPVPKDFFKLVGASAYETSSNDGSNSIIDNTLSFGPYYLDTWDAGQTITFKKNDKWWEVKENSSLYTIPGVHIAILTAAQTDDNAVFNEFLHDKLDSARIPTAFVNQYKSDPRTVSVPGSTTWKLNMNTTTQEQWNALFGTNGSIQKGTDNAYKVKPWMSNKNFLNGLYFSIDRNTYANNFGRNPALEYFGNGYQINPEIGLAYNDTVEHKKNMEDFWGDTISTGGYDLNLSEEFFTDAISELEAASSMPRDGKLTIDIWWQTQAQAKTEGDPLAKYIQDAFNAASKAAGKTYTLTVNNSAGAVWSDVYYKHLMVGDFDLGFGSISGSALNPLNFMEVLKSDNSSGFTLNWGPDTSEVKTGKDALEYDNKFWSFDSLWNAADHGTLIGTDGKSLPAFIVPDSADFAENDDGTATITFTMPSAKVVYPDLPDVNTVDFLIKNIWIQGANDSADTVEVSVGSDGKLAAVEGFEDAFVSGSYDWATGKVVLTISSDAVDACYYTVKDDDGKVTAAYYYFYFGMNAGLTIRGVTSYSNLYTDTAVPTALPGTGSSSAAA